MPKNGDESIKASFKKAPLWTKFNPESAKTSAIKNFWSGLTIGGGDITYTIATTTQE